MVGWSVGRFFLVFQCYSFVSLFFFFFLFVCLFLFREAVQEKPDVGSTPGPVVDVGVVRYTTSEILPKNVQAKPEQSEVAQKLIPSLSDAEIEEVSIVSVDECVLRVLS